MLGPALSLALVGTVVTAGVTGVAASWLFDLTSLEGLLLGSIVASTDGAAIFALLRGSTLRRRLARTLEGESGFNDPVAVLLVLGFIEWIQEPDYGLADMAGLFVIELASALAVGLCGGLARRPGVPRARLDSAGLYPVASLATAALAFGAADTLHGSGFLAVYLAGPALGSANDPGQADGHRVPRGARLGRPARDVPRARACSCSPSQLGDVAVRGTVLALVIVFVARPVAALRRPRRSVLRGGACSCSAGRACAAPCPSCSPRSR